MAIIQDRVTIALGTTNPNVLDGRLFRTLRAPSTVQAAVVGSAVGLIATFSIGDSIVSQRFPVRVEAAAGRGPIIPEDLKIVDVGQAGDELFLEVQNPTAGALDVDFYILIT